MGSSNRIARVGQTRAVKERIKAAKLIQRQESVTKKTKKVQVPKDVIMVEDNVVAAAIGTQSRLNEKGGEVKKKAGKEYITEGRVDYIKLMTSRTRSAKLKERMKTF